MESILNEDLTTLENITPFLKQCVGKGKEIPPGSILQVQSVTNVSFPTYDKPTYDSDKHTLKVTVTDGQSQGYALVPDSCPGISTNTAPGTKIKITNPVPVQGSLFVLTRNNCEVLGGKVAKLFEKWEIQKRMAIKHEWGYTGSSVEGEGPPPWKPFGYKPSLDVSALRKMKTIDVVNDKKGNQAGAAKTEFDVQREEAISELQATAAAANKQKFQKPNKHLLDKEITDIMEEGFSQSDAEYAMNRFKNTQKALKFLKEAKKRDEGLPREPPKPPMERKDFRRKKGKLGNDDEDDAPVPVEFQRPTKSISLFGFLEGHIKVDEKSSGQNPNNGSSQGYGRSRDLEDGMGRLNMKDSRNDSYFGRNERGRGRGGFRGGGRGNDRNREPYQSREQQQQYQSSRYDKSSSATEPGHRPPRFQHRGGNDYYNQTDSRNHASGGNQDNYRGQTRDVFDKSSFPLPSSDPPPRQDYGGGHQHRRPTEVKDNRTYRSGGGNDSYRSGGGTDSYRAGGGNDSYRAGGGNDYHQQFPKSNDYPVPSPYQKYPQQQQGPPQSRQYSNNNSQNHEYFGYQRSSGPTRGGGVGGPSPYYSNHSAGGHSNQPQHSEFGHYQYGYEGYNPAQSLVFTRSKGDTGIGGGSAGGGGGGRGRGGYQNSGGRPPSNTSYSRSNNRY